MCARARIETDTDEFYTYTYVCVCRTISKQQRHAQKLQKLGIGSTAKKRAKEGESVCREIKRVRESFLESVRPEEVESE